MNLFINLQRVVFGCQMGRLACDFPNSEYASLCFLQTTFLYIFLLLVFMSIRSQFRLVYPKKTSMCRVFSGVTARMYSSLTIHYRFLCSLTENNVAEVS